MLHCMHPLPYPGSTSDTNTHLHLVYLVPLNVSGLCTWTCILLVTRSHQIEGHAQLINCT